MESAATSNQEFVARLRECARSVGSALQLSRLTGIPNSSLSKYFNGTEPPRHNLIKIAAAANVSVAWLVTGEGPGESIGHPASVSFPVGAGMPGLIERINQLIVRGGGIDEISRRTKLSAQRLAQLAQYGQITLFEAYELCGATKAPISWLVYAGRFDPDAMDHVDSLLSQAITKVQVIDEAKTARHGLFGKNQPSLVSDGNFKAIVKLWEAILLRLEPARYRVFEPKDNLMSPTIDPNDVVLVEHMDKPGGPGIYLFHDKGIEFCARAIVTSDVTTFRFDNPKFDPELANRLLSRDADPYCVGRVVGVFGPAH